MAVTYSSGVSGINKEIVTTDLHHKCTLKHTGTSAAAPLAAGKRLFALSALFSLFSCQERRQISQSEGFMFLKRQIDLPF